MNDFWSTLEQLVSNSEISIDRPKGSAHPKFESIIYPLDYGYLEGTTGGDGDGIDIWVGSGDKSKVTGVVATVDVYKKDAELKILLGCSESEMELAFETHNTDHQQAKLIRRFSDGATE